MRAAKQGREIAEDVLGHALTDDQAIELAKVYALLAIAESLSKGTESRFGIQVPKELGKRAQRQHEANLKDYGNKGRDSLSNIEENLKTIEAEIQNPAVRIKAKPATYRKASAAKKSAEQPMGIHDEGKTVAEQLLAIYPGLSPEKLENYMKAHPEQGTDVIVTPKGGPPAA